MKAGRTRRPEAPDPQPVIGDALVGLAGVTGRAN